MQTIITSVLSNRTDAQNITSSPHQRVLPTQTEGSIEFIKAFEGDLDVLAETLVEASQDKPEKIQNELKSGANDKSNAPEDKIPADRIDVDRVEGDVSESTAPPHDHSKQLRPNLATSVDGERSMAAPQQVGAQIEPLFGSGTKAESSTKNETVLENPVPKSPKTQHQTVSSAFVNGFAQQSEIPLHTDHATRPVDETVNQIRNDTTGSPIKTPLGLDPKPQTGTGTPNKNQPVDFRRAETVQFAPHQATPTGKPDRLVHLGSHLLEQNTAPKSKAGLTWQSEAAQANTRLHRQSEPIEKITHLTSQPALQKVTPQETAKSTVVAPRQFAELKDRETTNTGSVSPVGVLYAAPSQSLNNSEAIAPRAVSEIPLKTPGNSKNNVSQQPFFAKKVQNPSVPLSPKTEPTPSQMTLPASQTPGLVANPRNQEMQTVVTPTPPSQHIQPIRMVTPAQKPPVTTVSTQMTLEPAALRSNDPIEEIVWDVRPQSTSIAHHQHGSAPHRHEMPGHIAQQLAQVMHRNPDRPIEIALNPAELGRVRMTLTPSETGIVVNILADRPETLDLMRRNINDLSESFSELGYEDIAFAFGQNENSSDASHEERSDTAGVVSLDLGEHENDASPSPDIPRLAISAEGIDLRL